MSDRPRMKIVVVESPGKAKPINKYLGSDYMVLASYGHVRDLPAKDGSVRPDEDFDMSWEVDAKSAKRLNDIAAAAKGADTLILATDPDREAEAISWHVLEGRKRKKPLAGGKAAREVGRGQEAWGLRGPGRGQGRELLQRGGGEDARPPLAAAALHHLDPAAGGLAQAGLQRAADHAGGPAAL